MVSSWCLSIYLNIVQALTLCFSFLECLAWAHCNMHWANPKTWGHDPRAFWHIALVRLVSQCRSCSQPTCHLTSHSGDSGELQCRLETKRESLGWGEMWVSAWRHLCVPERCLVGFARCVCSVAPSKDCTSTVRSSKHCGRSNSMSISHKVWNSTCNLYNVEKNIIAVALLSKR